MKDYVKPMVINSEEVAESVYMASGCWTAGGTIHQSIVVQNREDYRFQLYANHINEAHGGVTTWTITFDQPVKFKECNSLTYVSGNGSNTLVFTRNGVTNPGEHIGLGDYIRAELIFNSALLLLGFCQLYNGNFKTDCITYIKD